jgi:hypothetical protein
MHFPETKDIPGDEWDEAAEIVLAGIRAGKGIPSWLPNSPSGFCVRPTKVAEKER